nr:F-box protein SKIP31 [Ipomoea batatas]
MLKEFFLGTFDGYPTYPPPGHPPGAHPSQSASHHSGHGPGMGAMLATGAAGAVVGYGASQFLHGSSHHLPHGGAHYGHFGHGKFKHGKHGHYGGFGHGKFKHGKHGHYGPFGHGKFKHGFGKWKYCMRWGLRPPKRPRESAWKKMYIQRDAEDMGDFVRNCPSEFKEYYIQMQAAKRSQTPLLSQVNDDHIILDKTVADQISIWKKNKGLSDKVFVDHACSGETCTYYQIGDVFVCEKTGLVHVCDDTCREVVSDPTNGLLVCTISGHCFDRMLSPSEIEPDTEQQQGGGTDEAEPFMGSGRFARAYLLGYNCDDEKELEAALRFC